MYTIYDLIFWVIMGGFGGMLIGMAIMGVASSSGYDEAVSDAYDIGYEKGKEEYKRVMQKRGEKEKTM